ncbi:unnamed protein product, partial [Polarella glacialis]
MMILRRLALRLQVAYDLSRDFVRTSTQVIEEHKSLLWLVGTGSSALAGWAVYTMRRLHYERIEGVMSELKDQIQGFEKVAVLNRPERMPPERNMVLVLAPAVLSAFSVGYVAGRAVSSFKWRKQLRVNRGLAENRVYVAVIPEQLFE